MKEIDLIRSKYRAVFDTPLGREVLNHMLFEMHYFDAEIINPIEIALSNYAKKLLYYIGVWDIEHIENTSAIVDKLMELPLIPERKTWEKDVSKES